ncbi:zinc-dependent alcohol dehydrogenase family protein [Kineothrix sp. MB12-C1]|uniref:zinc-dependent alcohol dehydrogenase family protein n=1 Tax=Kineothrix sp. MB12-C1 TaxID=3070215 RepID=UPI0027D23FEE|nr:zinc-dependent alcohol dehydrogenase family protein [Kineothrix sp. MB12-C1]WMC91169.1 zinc-dependent alcohol dehydrogenase family protein [Kineothrix sp. MB12-C1]
MMKAAVFYGEKDLRIEEIEIPKPGCGEVLLKVHACGVCGTDVHIYEGDEGAAKSPAGTVLGHEFSGEIVEVGKGVTRLKAGDRVCVDPNKLCGKCEYCLSGIGHFCENMVGIGTTVNGGFAEYCVIPQEQAYVISDNLTFEEAAMAEPVACCLHGIDLCEIHPGDTVAVFGMGMIGLLMMQLARISGAAKIIAIEPVEVKRNQALQLGADLVIDPINEDIKEVLAANNIGRVNTVIECVGRIDSMKQAMEIAGKKSVVMLFGLTRPQEELPVKPFDLFRKEITLKASFINPYTQQRAVALIESGNIDVKSMISNRLPLGELEKVLGDSAMRSQGKIIINL